MESKIPTFPFEVSLEEILQDPDSYVDAIFSCLESEFLIMPKLKCCSKFQPFSVELLK